MKLDGKQLKAVAPGKIILSGEHAVVYGAPALVMAIDRNAVFELTPQQDERITFDLAGDSAESFTLLALEDFKRRVTRNYHDFTEGKVGIRDVLTKPVDLFKFAFIHTLDGLHRKLDNGLCLKLRSSIPVGCGMGSSAATVLSELRALGHYLRVDFRPEWYYEFSLEAERLQHGTPSGVDSYISLHGGCARFQDGQAQSVALPRVKMFLVQTGMPEATTGECVMQVQESFRTSSIWSEFEAVTDAMEQALAANHTERIYELVRENNRLLCSIGVVPKRIQQFIRTIEAWGGAAKVCGAGSIQGEQAGSVIVFAPESPEAICEQFGYACSVVRGDPLGTRLV